MPLLLCFTFFFSNCVNEDNYHEYITVKNQSEKDVYLAFKGLYYPDKCFMHSTKTLTKGEVFEFFPYNGRIESRLKGGSTLEFYLIDPSRFNKNGEYYDCDSIAIKNDILMHYNLTLEDLERMNWQVVYDGN